MNIRDIGWDSDFAESFANYAVQGLRPARVIVRNRNEYRLIGSDGEFSARLTGKLDRSATTGGMLPVVGDWVAVQIEDGFYGSTIRAVIPRRSSVSGITAGKRADKQVLAANIDTLFIVDGLDGNFKQHRLEHCLNVTSDIKVICVSAMTGQDLDQLRPFIQKGKTLAFIGSSGIGKATSVNCLLSVV